MSDGKERKAVVAGTIGLASPLVVGAEVSENDSSVGNDGAGGIGYSSDDVCGCQLRKRR